MAVTHRQWRKSGIGRSLFGRTRGGGGELSDSKEKVTDLFPNREFVHLAEDFLFHELELMQPDRCGDPDEERPPL